MPKPSLLAGVITLLRPPNVFTAVADSAAGLALVHPGLGPDPGLWCLPASACLYLGGMALNDFFDREVDARERPERPIPSGIVPAGLAAAIGGSLLVAGIVFAAFAGAVGVAIVLAAAILLYDGGLKGTPVGYLNMGLCRGLNFFLPMSLATSLPPTLLLPPLLLTAYVTALTYLSRDEVGGSSLSRARRALVALSVVLAAVALAVVIFGATLVGWLFFAALAARAVAIFGPLVRSAGGPAIGRAVGGGILLIPLFDATFVAAAGLTGSAIVVAALTIPAAWLKRTYSPT